MINQKTRIVLVVLMLTVPFIIYSQNSNNNPINNSDLEYIPLGTEQIESSQANALWPYGELGLGLTGEGYDKIGMWTVYRSYPYIHSEYSTRIEFRDFDDYSGYGIDIEDWPLLNDHDTQTAGIIIAAGNPNIDAKGIAYNATLGVYTGENMMSELASAASEGMELASYSYGYANNCYGEFDQNIDIVGYNSPNFLFIQGAGNSGTDLYGEGKNNLAVGSVQFLAGPYTNPGDVINGNSRIGPSADGRIKPDVVAVGGSTVSCIGTDGYTNAGPATSYAAPAVAGIGVLLQQHFQNNSGGVPMLAAELKGLLIHSADEAGPADGPDAEFGWGLVNAKYAAEIITSDTHNDDIITTNTLNAGMEYRKQIYSDGSEPIKVTVVWTDPPYNQTDCSDINPRLINDLDLKILKDGVTYYPWTLDTVDPTSAAHNNVENHLDNVEQVCIATSSAGMYTVQINHTGVLTNGSQNFSMIVSGNTSPSEMKHGILEYLEDLFPTSEERVNKRLEKAILLIEKSLADSLWEDQYYLTNYGGKVYNRERKAVEKLNWIVKDKKSSAIKAEAQEAIEDITAIDKLLTQLAIDDAIANNGDSKKIEKAIKQMEKAQKKIDKGKYAQSIEFYKNAWKFSQQALKKVGLGKIESATEQQVQSTVVDPNRFTLGNNYPNPFNPTTTISYSIPEYSKVSVVIYNLMGEKIRTLVAGSKAAGNYHVSWDGTNNNGTAVSTGMYFYELKAGGFKQVKRMTFMK